MPSAVASTARPAGIPYATTATPIASAAALRAIQCPFSFRLRYAAKRRKIGMAATSADSPTLWNGSVTIFQVMVVSSSLGLIESRPLHRRIVPR